jgi:competence ComEA-like helix-hairpin-helix protein
MSSNMPRPSSAAPPQSAPSQPAWATTLPPALRQPTAAPPPNTGALQPLLPPALQKVVAGLAVIGLAALAAWFVAAGGLTGGLVAYDTAPQGTTGYSVDLNTASHAELLQLPRVGPALADRIIERRETIGPYRSIDDLLDVPGIGGVTLADVKPFIRPLAPPTRPDGDPDDVRPRQ